MKTRFNDGCDKASTLFPQCYVTIIKSVCNVVRKRFCKQLTKICLTTLCLLIIIHSIRFTNIIDKSFLKLLYPENSFSKLIGNIVVNKPNNSTYRKSHLEFGTKGFPIFEPSLPLDECMKIIDSKNTKKIAITQVTDRDDERIQVTCDKILKRGNYSNEGDKEFSIAHVRVVYKDYHLHELILNLLYSPTNIFCYSIDEKATAIFKEQMKNLSQCFPNVFIAPVKYKVDSAGHNMDRAILSCLSLIRDMPFWKYVIALQNFDLPVKTNKEMVKILKALNGSNSVGIMPPILIRVPKYTDWSFKALKLFKNDSENDGRILRICKGNVGTVLSRKFVEFLIDKINPNEFLLRLDNISYGNDEMFFPSLNAADDLNAPGGYTQQCIGSYGGYIARFVSWSFLRQQCNSKIYRHKVCVYGYQDLAMFKGMRHLFANKLLPSTDYTAITCWVKYLGNRSSIVSHEKFLDTTFYSNMPNVLFNQHRTYWRQNLNKFNCSTGTIRNSIVQSIR